MEYLTIERQYSNNTIDAYKRDINDFITFNKGVDTNEHKINKYLEKLRKNYANNTYLRKVSALKNFYKYLCNNDLIDVNPFINVTVSKKNIEIPKYLSIKDINKLLNSLKYNTPLEARNKAMFEVLYASGMRISELVNLKYENVKLDDDLILVEGKGKKQRLLPINIAAKKYLKLYIDNYYNILNKKDSEYLFLNKNYTKITRQGFYKIVKQKANEAGIKDISPHMFRHSIATHMLNSGANLRIIQEMLGHESLTTTEIYAKVNNKTIKKEYDKFHPLNMRK